MDHSWRATHCLSRSDCNNDGSPGSCPGCTCALDSYACDCGGSQAAPSRWFGSHCERRRPKSYVDERAIHAAVAAGPGHGAGEQCQAAAVAQGGGDRTAEGRLCSCASSAGRAEAGGSSALAPPPVQCRCKNKDRRFGLDAWVGWQCLRPEGMHGEGAFLPDADGCTPPAVHCWCTQQQQAQQQQSGGGGGGETADSECTCHLPAAAAAAPPAVKQLAALRAEAWATAAMPAPQMPKAGGASAAAAAAAAAAAGGGGGATVCPRGATPKLWCRSDAQCNRKRCDTCACAEPAEQDGGGGVGMPGARAQGAGGGGAGGGAGAGAGGGAGGARGAGGGTASGAAVRSSPDDIRDTGKRCACGLGWSGVWCQKRQQVSEEELQQAQEDHTAQDSGGQSGDGDAGGGVMGSGGGGGDSGGGGGDSGGGGGAGGGGGGGWPPSPASAAAGGGGCTSTADCNGGSVCQDCKCSELDQCECGVGWGGQFCFSRSKALVCLHSGECQGVGSHCVFFTAAGGDGSGAAGGSRCVCTARRYGPTCGGIKETAAPGSAAGGGGGGGMTSLQRQIWSFENEQKLRQARYAARRARLRVRHRAPQQRPTRTWAGSPVPPPSAGSALSTGDLAAAEAAFAAARTEDALPQQVRAPRTPLPAPSQWQCALPVTACRVLYCASPTPHGYTPSPVPCTVLLQRCAVTNRALPYCFALGLASRF
jgi:hypothetical protein